MLEVSSLSERSESENKKARVGRLVRKYLEFTKALAKQFCVDVYASRHLDYDDIEGAAFLGLCDAARRYEGETDERFKTYAYFRIRGSMYDLARTSGFTKRGQFKDLISSETEEDEKKVERKLPYAFAKNASELGSLNEVISYAGIKVYAETPSMPQITYSDELSPEEACQLKRSREYLLGLINRLPERERKVILFKYFQDKSSKNIRGEVDNLSESTISRTHKSAIYHLKRMLKEEVRASTVNTFIN